MYARPALLALGRLLLGPLFLGPLAFGAVAPGETLTVDDDGPADFPSVAAALAAASPGALIQIAPGHYPQTLHLTQAVTLTGLAGGERPRLGRITAVSAWPIFLHRLELESLRLDAVVLAAVDHCLLVRPDFDIDQPNSWTFEAHGGVYLAVRDSEISALPHFGTSNRGAWITGSQTQAYFVRSTIRGGDGLAGTGGGMGQGATGLTVGGARVALIDSQVFGGNGQSSLAGLPLSGQGGVAVLGVSGHVDVRGTAAQLIAGGVDDPLAPGGPVHAPALIAGPGSTIEQGPVTVLGASNATPVAARPRLLLDSSGVGGTVATAHLFGTAGNLGVLAAALPSGLVTVLPPPGPGLPLWLDPGQLLILALTPLTGAASAAPVAIALPTGPSLVGVALVLQMGEIRVSTGQLTLANALVLGLYQ
jgi:hypothetical protein